MVFRSCCLRCKSLIGFSIAELRPRPVVPCSFRRHSALAIPAHEERQVQLGDEPLETATKEALALDMTCGVTATAEPARASSPEQEQQEQEKPAALGSPPALLAADNHPKSHEQQRRPAFTRHVTHETLKRLRESAPTSGVVYQDEGATRIPDEVIGRHVWAVLLRLRMAGHDSYLVGGAVRDVLLDRRPKDVDILTTATAGQVRALFRKARCVGKAFPICHVPAGGQVLEVSSFVTSLLPHTEGAAKSQLPPDVAARVRQSADVHKKESRRPRTEDEVMSENLSISNSRPSWAEARRDNALQRDFTVNALLYDPFSRTLFDYVGGVVDCRRRVLRTIGHPDASFTHDPVRMLRALRLASRTGLALETSTRKALMRHVGLLAGLSQSRIQLEMQALMSYGASAAAVELLFRYRALDIILPAISRHLSALRVPRDRRRSAKPPPYLHLLLSKLDERVSSSLPAPPAAWVAMLMAVLVAEKCQQLRQGQRSALAELEEDLGGPLTLFASVVESVRWGLGAPGPSMPFPAISRVPVDAAAHCLIQELRQRPKSMEEAKKTQHSSRDKHQRGEKRAMHLVMDVLRDPAVGWAQASALPDTMPDPLS